MVFFEDKDHAVVAAAVVVTPGAVLFVAVPDNKLAHTGACTAVAEDVELWY